jgi:hypothetical protein
MGPYFPAVRSTASSLLLVISGMTRNFIVRYSSIPQQNRRQLDVT